MPSSRSEQSPCCRSPRWLRRGITIGARLYLPEVLLVWLVLFVAGDRWYFATLMLFGPRWLYAAPLAVLVPAAAWFQRRLLWPLAVSALVAIGPLMGLCLPWGRCGSVAGPSLRVLTCNVKGHCRDNAVLNVLIRETAPDLVALQGCWHSVKVNWPTGWQVRQEGEVLVASRYPLRDAEPAPFVKDHGRRSRTDLMHCVVEAPFAEFHFAALHLPSIHEGISEVLDRSTLIRPSRSNSMAVSIAVRRRASEDVSRWISGFSEAVIVAGDLNMPTDSTIYRACWDQLSNAFSNSGFGFGYTEWPTIRDWRFGIRIDHVLSGPAWRPRRCWVGPDVGSDHLPLIADLVWTGPAREKQ